VSPWARELATVSQIAICSGTHENAGRRQITALRRRFKNGFSGRAVLAVYCGSPSPDCSRTM
jgi:hypothetical protein